jgi:UDP-N-acetyl-D-mannosaminuronic acid dehydrogenase
MARVCLLGLGHVGRPLAAVLARVHDVWAHDTAPAVLEAARGPQVEPGLEAVSSLPSLRLERPDGPVDVVVVAVGTPLGPSGADLRAVHRAAADAAELLGDDGLLLLVSTCPVGTARKLAERLGRPVATSPERGMPGRMLEEMITNPRLVGGTDAATTDAAVAFVRTWCTGLVDPVEPEEAELCKLVENSWRDVSIAFANDLATTCERLGLDPQRVTRLAEGHPRVRLARPGIGVGGHCLPVDPHFLPPSMELSRAARSRNHARTHTLVERIRRTAQERGAVTIGCLGLAYKADVADARNAPAVRIVAALGAVAHDPLVTVPGMKQAPLDEVLACDLVVKLVPHQAYARVWADLDLTR